MINKPVNSQEGRKIGYQFPPSVTRNPFLDRYDLTDVTEPPHKLFCRFQIQPQLGSSWEYLGFDRANPTLPNDIYIAQRLAGKFQETQSTG